MRISILKSSLESDNVEAQPRAHCLASGVRVQIFANLDPKETRVTMNQHPTSSQRPSASQELTLSLLDH